MPDKMPWEEDWGGKPDAPAPWEEDWSGATVDATPPIASNPVRDALLAEKKKRGIDKLAGNVTPDELAAVTPETQLPRPQRDIPYARSVADERPGIIDRLLAGADTTEKVLETAQRWNIPNNIFESGRKVLAPLRAASTPTPEETPTVGDIASVLGGQGAIPPVRDFLEKHVGPTLNPAIAKAFGAATAATQPIRDFIAPSEDESALKAAAMLPVRTYAQARDILGLDPANAVLSGGTAGMGAIARGVQAASEGAFLADMLRNIPPAVESVVDAGVNRGAAGAMQALPEAAVPIVMSGMLAHGLKGKASAGIESARTTHNLKKTQRIVEENYQRALVKASLNEKAGRPRLEGMDEGELTAYFSDERNAEPLRRTQSVDELETIARQMFTGRPETKVVIHENWDSVPKNLRPVDSAAQAKIPSLIDHKSDTIHVIRNAPNATGGGLIRNVKHEIGHKLDDFKPEEVTDALSGMMRERLPQMMAEHGVPAGEVTRLLSMDQPAFAAEMKRMAVDANPEISKLPTILAREAVATMMQQYRADPSKVSLFMAKAARKIPGVQMTANDIRAIMSERINAREGGAAQIETVGEKPAEVMPKPEVPAAQPAAAVKKGDRVYLPSSDPSIRMFDTGTVTSIGRDGKVRVVVGGRKGRAGDRFIELPPDQVSLEPPDVARRSVEPEAASAPAPGPVTPEPVPAEPQRTFGVDRRKHAEIQQQFEGRRWMDLSDAERIERGYMNEKTGLPNLRHFEDFVDTPEGRAQRPYASFYDLDDFKPMNTRLSHDGVDKVVLPVIGDTIKEVMADKRFADIVDVSHIQGDEFLARAATREATDAFWGEVNNRLKDAEFSYTMPDGTVYTWKGLGGSHGVGPDRAAAEADLARAKEARKAAGLRVGYRDQDVAGSAAGREAVEGAPERQGVDAGDGLDAGDANRVVEPAPDVSFQNQERESFSRANKNLIDPIRGDLIRFGSTLVDKHNTLESFVNKMSEGLEGSAKLETQKMAADIFEDAKAYRQGQVEVESVLDKLEQGVKAKGNLGKPESGPTRDLLEAVDAAREAVDIPHRRKDTDVEREAIKLRAKLGRQGVINLAVDVAKGMTLPKGIKNTIAGNLRMLSDVETLAIRMEMNDLKSLEDGMNDPKKFMENVLLANAYRTTGSDPARSLRMRRWDIGMSDVDRVRSVIYDMIYDPSSRNAAALANKDSAFHKEAVRKMNKQLERTKKFLKDELKIEKVEDIPEELLLDKRFMKNFVDRMSAAVAPMSAKARTWYINAILSRPKTHVANMTGNALNFVTEYYGHRRLEALINDLTKNKEGVRSSDLSGLMAQLISIQNSAFKQAMALEGSSLKIEGGLVGQAKKDAKEFFKTREAQLRRRIEGDDWIGELREKKQSFAGKPGKVITLPSRALGAADEFSKSLIGHMEALVNARMIARQSGHAVGSESYNAEVYKQLADYDSQAWHRALDRAEYMAFQQENRKVVKSLLALRHAHPNLSFVVPFITTPVNLFTRAAEFVPGVGISFRGDIGLTKGALAAKGDESANYKSRMIAAQTMGSAATVMIAALGLDAFKEDNDEPWITGSEPPPKFSKGEREARQRSLQPYTIKNPFGEGRVSYKRLDPLSTTTAVIVDGVHAIRDLARHGDPTRAAAILKQSLLGQAIGKTFLQTPGEIIQWLQDRPGADPLGPVKTIAAGFYPGILQAATQFFFEDFVRERRQYGAKEGDLGQEPGERFAKTFLNRVTGLPSVPGLGTLAEPGVTVYGDEKRLGGSPLYRFTMPFDYYPGGSPDARTFDLRFLRGLETLPDAEDSLPTEMAPTVRLAGQTVALSPEDWAAAEKERGKLYLDTLRAAGLTKDRRKPMEAWELEAAKEINRTAGQVVRPYAAKYFGGK